MTDTVTVAEIAAASGRKPAAVEVEARELGLLILSDWAGRAALSLGDARSLVSGQRRRVAEHEQAWAAHQADNRAWLLGRAQAVTEASRKARDERRPGPVDGETWAAGVQAANKAAEKYERSTPRPTFNGQPTLPTEYIREGA
jgi:hypothetical protein